MEMQKKKLIKKNAWTNITETVTHAVEDLIQGKCHFILVRRLWGLWKHSEPGFDPPQAPTGEVESATKFCCCFCSRKWKGYICGAAVSVASQQEGCWFSSHAGRSLWRSRSLCGFVLCELRLEPVKLLSGFWWECLFIIFNDIIMVIPWGSATDTVNFLSSVAIGRDVVRWWKCPSKDFE